MGRVVDIEEIAEAVAPERRVGKRIVLTNGCFDLLHVGHARLLNACRAYGDVLVVGVNDDESVTLLKGPERPFVPAADRAELVAALSAVDYVTIFPERTAMHLASLLKPDVYVKGADYVGSGSSGIDETRLPEARVVEAHGGRVVLVPLVPDRSSTALAERVRAGVAGLATGTQMNADEDR